MKSLINIELFILLLNVFLLNILVLSDYRCADATKNECDENCMTYSTWFRKENKKSSWNGRHPFILKVFIDNNIKESVEVGMARGGLTQYLLENVPNLTHHGVDPFIGGYDNSGDGFSRLLERLNISNTWANSILYNMKEYNCNFKLHHNMSHKGVLDFQDNSMDLVFLDGDHTYEGITLDISIWIHKVKIGGILAFDDYGPHFTGVYFAVNQFVAINDIKLHYMTTSKLGNVYIYKDRNDFNTSLSMNITEKDLPLGVRWDDNIIKIAHVHPH